MARGVAAVQLWWGWEAAERRDHGGAELCAAMAWRSEVAVVLWRRWRGEIRSQERALRAKKEA